MTKMEQLELQVLDKAVHCAGCEARIEAILKKLAGVQSVKADHKTQTVRFTLDPDRIALQAVKERLAAIGYETAWRQVPWTPAGQE